MKNLHSYLHGTYKGIATEPSLDDMRLKQFVKCDRQGGYNCDTMIGTGHGTGHKVNILPCATAASAAQSHQGAARVTSISRACLVTNLHRPPQDEGPQKSLAAFALSYTS